MPALDQIATIVIVMMENRSFDHVLGHLRMPEHGNRLDIDGLVDPTENVAYTNFLGSEGFQPFHRADAPLPHDLPHARDRVAVQLARQNGIYTMSGFVEAYVGDTGSVVQDPPPLGFLTPDDVPMSHFLASEYAVCHRWFAPLPTDTQPNRCVAFSGSTLVDDTKLRIIPVTAGQLLFDWLSARGISWRVYYAGLSSFALFGRVDLLLGPHFRSLSELPRDVAQEALADVPQVILVEPEYGDSPVHWSQAPNDNHPPLPIGPGERFLRDVYTALSSNPARWRRTLLIVTHDEHGGFFDHHEPFALPTPVAPGAEFSRPFESTGPRVPALVVSPLVARGRVFDGVLDHTSILQLIAERFTGNPDYNDEVRRRRLGGIGSLSAVLEDRPRADIPPPPPAPSTQALPAVAVAPAVSENQKAFAAAGRQLLAANRDLALRRFPELAHLPEDGNGVS